MLHFDVWVIDPTHLKFIETDSTAYLAGDAFVSTGQTTFPSGALVYTLSGEDTTLGPFSAGGLLTSDGSSLITEGLEDVNDEGDVAEAPSINGTFNSNGPRTVLTLDGIYNGSLLNDAIGTGNYTFCRLPVQRRSHSVDSHGRGTIQFPSLQTGGNSVIGLLI